MIYFEQKNVNPKGKKTDDCVIRAISTALNKEYIETYRELFEYSLKTGYMINEKRNYEKYLKDKGFVKFKQPTKMGTKIKIKQISESTDIEDKTILVTCCKHLTVIKQNILIDIWDAREQYIRNYWIK